MIAMMIWFTMFIGAVNSAFLYEETDGYCRGGENWPGMSTLWNCLEENGSRLSMTEDECLAQCDDTADCHAFDLIPGDQSECCLFTEGNTGNGGDGRSCFVRSVVYEETAGYCRGGDNWPGTSTLWNCVESGTEDECQAQCDDAADCYAFDLVPGGESECCLFTEGNTGNGADGRSCFVQSVTAPTEEPSAMPTSEPTKNCDLLQIDEFLLDCSAEWGNAENTISTMEASVETNAADILTAATSIAANTADIATNAADTATNAADIVTNAADIASCTSSASTNAADISTNAADIGTATTSIAANTEDIGTNTADIASYTSSATTNMTSAQASITSLETRVAELEDILDQLAGNSAAEDAAADRLINYPLQGDNVGMMDGMWNGVTLTGKDLGIVVLAAINVIMIVCMVIACKRSGGRTKYQAVAVGSDIEPMNA